MIIKILKTLLIIQERQVKDAFNITKTQKRINPYNPLSYVFFCAVLIIGIFAFGIVGVWGELEVHNEFKWR
jgi:hypothetical protein